MDEDVETFVRARGHGVCREVENDRKVLPHVGDVKAERRRAGLSHLAVAAPHPAPRARADDPIGDVDVPELGDVLRLVGLEQRLELAHVGDGHAAQAEPLAMAARSVRLKLDPVSSMPSARSLRTSEP
jgi:hypothetical protein